MKKIIKLVNIKSKKRRKKQERKISKMSICYVIMLVFMTGMFCIVSFIAGILSASNKNKIKLNPIEAYKEHKEIKQQKEINNLEQRQNAIMMDNINKYDGTSRGQSDIPNQ